MIHQEESEVLGLRYQLTRSGSVLALYSQRSARNLRSTSMWACSVLIALILSLIALARTSVCAASWEQAKTTEE